MRNKKLMKQNAKKKNVWPVNEWELPTKRQLEGYVGTDGSMVKTDHQKTRKFFKPKKFMKKVASISELVQRPPMSVNLAAATLEQAVKVVKGVSGDEKTGLLCVRTLWVKLVRLFKPLQQDTDFDVAELKTVAKKLLEHVKK